MKNLLKSNDTDALIYRLAHIKPTTPGKWGKMNAHQMIVHLRDPLRAAIGDRPVPFQSTVLSVYPLNKLISQVLPWIKSAPTAEEFIQGKKGSPLQDFESDRQQLLLEIQRFVRHAQQGTYCPNPVFGKLSNKEWGRLMWRHIDHHLRQFGV